MAQIAYNPKFQAFDDTGAPLAGGKLYTYEAGTSTPKTTWSDSGEVTPNANPVVLDSRGEATIYGSGTYKFILKTSADATVWTVDNIAISGTVTTSDIQDGAVTTAKLASNVLTADATGRGKMQDGFVTSAKLDTGGVALPNGSTATTQATGDSTTKPATTAFVQGEFTDKTATQSEMESASSTTDFVTPGRQKNHPMHPKAVGAFSLSGGAMSSVYASGCSFVRDSQGLVTVTISTAMSSSSYAVLANANGTGGNATEGITVDVQSRTTTTFVLKIGTYASGVTDAPYVTFAVFGDQ